MEYKIKNAEYRMANTTEKKSFSFFLSALHSKFQIPNSKRGFTMIELILYVALASVLLMATSAFLGVVLESRVKNQTISEVETQGMQTMHTILQTIRNAEAITSPTQGANATSLTLNVVNASNDPTIFDVSSGALRIKEGVGATISLTNSRVTASDVTFTNLSRTDTPGIVRVEFTLSLVNNSGRNEYDYSKTFISSASLRHP